MSSTFVVQVRLLVYFSGAGEGKVLSNGHTKQLVRRLVQTLYLHNTGKPADSILSALVWQIFSS